MIVTIKPTASQAPLVKMLKVFDKTGGTPAGSVFRGADILTTGGAVAMSYFFVLEDFFQDLTCINSSGNTDINGYPELRRVGAYTGEDEVFVQRGNWKKRLALDFTTETQSEIRSSVGIAIGQSYLRYSFEWLEGLLTGVSDPAVYTAGGLRNTACWAASLNLTGIPYSNSSGGPQKNGGMITPRHMVGCVHYSMEIGDTYTFKDAANNSTTRTVIGISESSNATGDARVYALSSDVALGIAVYPVAGRWLFVTSEAGVDFTTSSQFVGFFVDRDRNASFVRVCDYESFNLGKRSGTIGGIVVTDYVQTLRFDAFYPAQIIPEFESIAEDYIPANTGTSGSGVYFKVASGLAIAATFGSGLGGAFYDEAFANALIISANNNAVTNGYTRPPDYTVTVAPSPV